MYISFSVISQRFLSVGSATMRYMVQINRVGTVGFFVFAAFQQQFSSAVAIRWALATNVGVGTLLPVVGIYLKAKIPASHQPDLCFGDSSAIFFSNFCQPENFQTFSAAHCMCRAFFQVNLWSPFIVKGFILRKPTAAIRARWLQSLLLIQGLPGCILWSMILKVHLIILRSTLVTVLFLRVPSVFSPSLYFEHFFVHFHWDPRADVCYW